MRKLIFALLFLINQSFAQSNHGYFRDVDSTGLIFIITTTDTLSSIKNKCAVKGIIMNKDSQNVFLLTYVFKTPVTINLNDTYKLKIKFKNGDVLDFPYAAREENYEQGDFIEFYTEVTKEILHKMKKKKVLTISLIKDECIRAIDVEKESKKTLGKLSQFMLTVDVYKEKEISWTELSQFKFPEN